MEEKHTLRRSSAHPRGGCVHTHSSGTLKPALCLPVMALSEHPELKKSLTPPLIIHTAATPMPMPKSAMFGDAAQGYESRRASGVSMDPAAYELKSPVRTRASCGCPTSIRGAHVAALCSVHPPAQATRTARHGGWHELTPSLSRSPAPAAPRTAPGVLAAAGPAAAPAGTASAGRPASSGGARAASAGPCCLGKARRAQRMGRARMRSAPAGPAASTAPYLIAWSRWKQRAPSTSRTPCRCLLCTGPAACTAVAPPPLSTRTAMGKPLLACWSISSTWTTLGQTVMMLMMKATW